MSSISWRYGYGKRPLAMSNWLGTGWTGWLVAGADLFVEHPFQLVCASGNNGRFRAEAVTRGTAAPVFPAGLVIRVTKLSRGFDKVKVGYDWSQVSAEIEVVRWCNEQEAKVLNLQDFTPTSDQRLIDHFGSLTREKYQIVTPSLDNFCVHVGMGLVEDSSPVVRNSDTNSGELEYHARKQEAFNRRVWRG